MFFFLVFFRPILKGVGDLKKHLRNQNEVTTPKMSNLTFKRLMRGGKISSFVFTQVLQTLAPNQSRNQSQPEPAGTPSSTRKKTFLLF